MSEGWTGAAVLLRADAELDTEKVFRDEDVINLIRMRRKPGERADLPVRAVVDFRLVVLLRGVGIGGWHTYRMRHVSPTGKPIERIWFEVLSEVPNDREATAVTPYMVKLTFAYTGEHRFYVTVDDKPLAEFGVLVIDEG